MSKPHIFLHCRVLPSGELVYMAQIHPKPLGRLGYTMWHRSAKHVLSAVRWSYWDKERVLR